MNAAATGLGRPDRRTWVAAAAIAIGSHLAVAVAVLGWSRPAPTSPPEPVMLVELPAEAGAKAATAPSQHQAMPAAAQPTAAMPTVAMPQLEPVRTPLPADPVTPAVAAPPEPLRPVAPAPALPAALPVPAGLLHAGAGNGASAAPGTDPRARAAEVDYYSLLSAYLNRRKTYPAEARRARQEGIVIVRFTVDRDGAVSGTAIKRSSGHDLLDQATLDLLQRVAPLPRMPAAMQRQTMSLALPIAYSLKTS